MIINVGIIGNGFVGNATSQFENEEVAVKIYDIESEKCKPVGLTLEELSKESDIIFICLPTPMKRDGGCYLGIIEGVILKMKTYIDFDEKIVVIRSTVPISTSERLNCFFMPEFLTESNAKKDFRETECWVFGMKENKEEQNKRMRETVTKILETNVSYGNINSSNSVFVKSGEAEGIKLFKNTFLAVKVSFCNEFYRYCESMNINYDNVIKGVVTDSRISSSHTKVPGNSGKFGFGGTCFPKDISSLQFEMKNKNLDSPVINGVIERNNKIDRIDQDWLKNKGRAVVEK